MIQYEHLFLDDYSNNNIFSRPNEFEELKISPNTDRDLNIKWNPKRLWPIEHNVEIDDNMGFKDVHYFL